MSDDLTKHTYDANDIMEAAIYVAALIRSSADTGAVYAHNSAVESMIEINPFGHTVALAHLAAACLLQSDADEATLIRLLTSTADDIGKALEEGRE